MKITKNSNSLYIKQDDTIVAEITFQLKDDVLYVDNTFVDSSLRGQGIASKLVDELISFAITNNYKIKPICSYVVKWFNEHSEYHYLLV